MTGVSLGALCLPTPWIIVEAHLTQVTQAVSAPWRPHPEAQWVRGHAPREQPSWLSVEASRVPLQHLRNVQAWDMPGQKGLPKGSESYLDRRYDDLEVLYQERPSSTDVLKEGLIYLGKIQKKIWRNRGCKWLWEKPFDKCELNSSLASRRGNGANPRIFRSMLQTRCKYYCSSSFIVFCYPVKI